MEKAFTDQKYDVAIIGAGPSGLLLARMLLNRGISCLLFENRNEKYLRRLRRGGYLSDAVLSMVKNEMKSPRLDAFVLRVDSMDVVSEEGKKSYPTSEISTFYANILDQHILANALLDDVQSDDCPILFEAKAQRYEGLEADEIKIVFSQHGKLSHVYCSYVVGSDGYNGISRRCIPPESRNEYLEELPLAWLEWTTEEACKGSLIHKGSDHFAMCTATSEGGSRYYLQVKRGWEIDDLPEENELWEMVESRLRTSFQHLPMLDKRLDYMRVFYTHAMQFGRLYIAGDAAHQVPRFGSASLNLGLMDVERLARAFETYYKFGSKEELDEYSALSTQFNKETILDYAQLNAHFHSNE
ncbi:MAG: FAD-dependent monooxygenase [Saprospiraceae bacterium]|nr:FAD-dependent monooxygenase [Saprospiraceae bacterium]